MGQKYKHKSGATSSHVAAKYYLIPKAALDALARRFTLGAEKHAQDNYKKGDSDFANERLNHLWEHLTSFTETRTQGDLDAIICNAAMLCWFKANGRMPDKLVLHSDHDSIPIEFK